MSDQWEAEPQFGLDDGEEMIAAARSKEVDPEILILLDVKRREKLYVDCMESIKTDFHLWPTKELEILQDIVEMQLFKRSHKAHQE